MKMLNERLSKKMFHFNLLKTNFVREINDTLMEFLQSQFPDENNVNEISRYLKSPKCYNIYLCYRIFHTERSEI